MLKLDVSQLNSTVLPKLVMANGVIIIIIIIIKILIIQGLPIQKLFSTCTVHHRTQMERIRIRTITKQIRAGDTRLEIEM